MSRAAPYLAVVLSAAALLVALFRSPPAPEPGVHAAIPTPTAPSDTKLAGSEDLAGLRNVIGSLLSRVEALEQGQGAAPGAAPAAPAPDLRRELDAMRVELDALVAAAPASPTRHPVAERIPRRDAQGRAQAQAMGQFFLDSGLSQTQATELNALLDAEAAEQAQLAASGRYSDLAGLKARTEAAAEQLLSPVQLKSFKAARVPKRNLRGL